MRIQGAATLFMTLTLALTACGGAGPATATASQSGPSGVQAIAELPLDGQRESILESGARSEGSVVMYTSSSGLEPLSAAFQKKYPFLKLEVVTARAEPLVQRALAEGKAGRMEGDVLQTNLFAYNDLKDLTLKFNAFNAKFDRVPNGASLDYSGIVFAYSKDRVKPDDVPQRVEDLLSPRWKGKIGLYAPPNNFSGRWISVLVQFMGEQGTRDFLTKLGDQNPSFYTSAQAPHDGLLSGEFDLAQESNTTTIIYEAKGQPIGWSAVDPMTVSPDIVTLFKGAPHPHAAMLFLDWILSPEGQTALKAIHGSISPDELEKREVAGHKLPQRIGIQSLDEATKLEGYMTLFDQLVAHKST